MTTFLLAILILDGLFMAVVILLQAGKGGGLAAVGGGAAMTEGILAGRQATNLLTKATWISGTIFLTTSLALSIISSRNAAPSSVIDVAPVTAAPAPILGSPAVEVPDEGEGTGTASEPSPTDGETGTGGTSGNGGDPGSGSEGNDEGFGDGVAQP